MPNENGKERIQLDLDPELLKRARRQAAMRLWSLEELFSAMLTRFEGAPKDSLLGLFADEPELMDQVLESIMKDRERMPLRTPIE